MDSRKAMYERGFKVNMEDVEIPWERRELSWKGAQSKRTEQRTIVVSGMNKLSSFLKGVGSWGRVASS